LREEPSRKDGGTGMAGVSGINLAKFYLEEEDAD